MTSTDPHPTPHHDAPPAAPVWGGQQASAQGWSRKTTLAAVGIAVLLTAGGGLAIYAATEGGGGQHGGPGFGGPGGQGMGPGMAGPGMGGPGMGRGGMGSGGMGPGQRPLHGEFVVADDNGGYRTEVTQTGTVTAVSDTSITAKSADDYSRTYVIDANTRTMSQDSVQVGDTAAISATVDGQNAVATSIVEAGAR